jgi:methyl-accepting chemotaxis protein
MKNIKIALRIWLPITLLVATLLVSVGLVLIGQRQAMMADRRGEVEAITTTALGIIKEARRREAEGLLTTAEAQDMAKVAIRAMTYGQGDYVFVYDQAGNVLVNAPDPSKEGGNRMGLTDVHGVRIIEALINGTANGGSLFLSYDWPRPGAADPQPKVSYAVGFQPWGWMLGSGVYVDDVTQAFESQALGMVGVILVILLGAATVAALSVRSITQPLAHLTHRMIAVAEGKLDLVVDGTDRRDEIGAMARALEVLRDTSLENVRLHEEQARAKDREVQDRRRLRESLATDFESGVGSMLEQLVGASRDLDTAARSLDEAAGEAQDRAQVVSSNTDTAAGNVDSVAAAAEELSASIGEIGQQVTRAAQVTGRAVDQVSNTRSQVAALVGAAERIGAVVNLITDIAEQTNLLALNATIEAARAGDAGKGFAVVAHEVKTLASQTARATDEISRQISDLQSQTRSGGEAIQAISATVAEINGIAEAIASAMEEQSAATREISRNIQEASSGTARVSESIGGVLAAAAQTGAAANQVGASAGQLKQTTDDMRARVVDFVSRVRAG